MDKTSFDISLPTAMRDFIESKVESGGYGTASKYVCELIQEAQRREAREEVEAKLLEAVESGPSTHMTRKDWDELKRRIVSRTGGDAPR